MFITFEGPDGSGKTTALNKLKKDLEKDKIKVHWTREPGNLNDPVTRKIREIILEPSHEISPMTEVILYSADRRSNLEKNIWPKLEKGEIVISDRYFDSTIAYQGYARGLEINEIWDLQMNITNKTIPDYTFFFDVKPSITEKRVSLRKDEKDRIELESSEFREKVYEGYKKLIEKDKERFIIINAEASIEEVYTELKEKFYKIMKEGRYA